LGRSDQQRGRHLPLAARRDWPPHRSHNLLGLEVVSFSMSKANCRDYLVTAHPSPDPEELRSGFMWVEKLLLITVALGVLFAQLFHFPMGLSWGVAEFFAAITSMFVMLLFCLLYFVR
jgi:hypothetical protein